jgi:hypothetical protein
MSNQTDLVDEMKAYFSVHDHIDHEASKRAMNLVNELDLESKKFIVIGEREDGDTLYDALPSILCKSVIEMHSRNDCPVDVEAEAVCLLERAMSQ